MKELEDLLQSFNALADANDWHPKHSPKNLAAAVNVEAGELLELFQWLSEEESQSLSKDQREQVSDEIADVFLYLLALSDKLDVSLLEAARVKMSKNQKRYT